jgi:16S rRNA (cytosine1402-N4)-methyltransferase
MRYDTSNNDTSTAHDIVNSCSEYDLIGIFKKFGEEKYPELLAKAIIKGRQGTMINTTGELKQIIRETFQGNL